MNFLDGYIEAGKRIKNKQARHEFYGSLVDYYESEEGEIPTFKYEIAEVAFWGVKFSLDKARAGRSGGQANRQATTEAKAEATPEANRQAKAKQLPKQTPNETRTKEKEEEKEELKEETPSGVSKKSSRFSPPTPEEVQAFADSLEQDTSHFCAQRFCDYYAAQGWKLSNGNSMKDWKAAVRNWLARDKPTSRPKSKKEVKLDDVFAKYGRYYDEHTLNIEDLERVANA